ncbi:MAG TPA: response regulator [Thermoanaerobaculia bacterium]|jgi:CheY-like chemotaxis protein
MAKRILLADDSITIQKVVELTFSDGDYEVVAVNNGAKAIQKLAEMRPDVILSDIIMPEKNGYEVCEFVKSHPEYRTIPVVLLTGTFEPFDPDRADKAGCDAVVTKPFESQSLIHKVDELIQAAQHSASAAAEAAAAPPAPAPVPTPEPEPAGSPWADETAATEESPFSFQPHTNDIFDAAPSQMAESAANEMPFETPPTEAFSSETRAFTKMSFEDLQRIAEPQPPAPEPPPIHEEAPAFGGETRAFPRMSFEDLEKMTEQAAPAPPPPPAPEAAESLPWEEQTPAFGAPMAAAPEPPAAIHEPDSPFGEEMPAFSGETRAFTKMSFEDLQQMAPPPAPEPAFESPAFEPAPAFEPPPPFEPEPESQRADSPVFDQEVPFEAPVEPEISSPPAMSLSGDVSDEVIEKIARRVVQMLSADEVKKIAWEVIPDMAEMVVKERIRQLESEA